MLIHPGKRPIRKMLIFGNAYLRNRANVNSGYVHSGQYPSENVFQETIIQVDIQYQFMELSIEERTCKQVPFTQGDFILYHSIPQVLPLSSEHNALHSFRLSESIYF